MTLHKMRKRLQEIETLFEGCTVEEYRDLSREYSILVGRIEAEENLYNPRQKVAEVRSMAAKIMSQPLPSSYHSLNQ